MDWKIQLDKDNSSPQINIQVNPIFTKIPARFLVRDKIVQEFIWERKGNNLEKH